MAIPVGKDARKGPSREQRNNATAIALYQAAFASGGGTVDGGGYLADFTSGAVVGGVVPETRIVNWDSDAGVAAIEAWVAEHDLYADHLGTLQYEHGGGLYYGAWVDGAALVLDISQYFGGVVEGIRVAKDRGERAVYLPALKDCVWVSEPSIPGLSALVAAIHSGPPEVVGYDPNGPRQEAYSAGWSAAKSAVYDAFVQAFGSQAWGDAVIARSHDD